MDKFIYKKSAGITALAASITEFTYKKHSHKEYAIGVTLRGIQHYTLDGSLQLLYQNGVMLFHPEQAHTGILPYQYFLNCKIERAKQLIEKKRDIYSAVAECGFVDLAHVNKHFKSVYGTTAFEYLSHVNGGGRRQCR